MKPSTQMDTNAAEGKLGTFAGVFTPSILTILGIILFLRLGYVAGSAGLGRTLVIIALANAISVFTSFSLSAVATNMKVRGGGDYYLISRILGLASGGAIGLVLFLAQSISIGFYCIGFAESIAVFLPQLHPMTSQFIAGGAVLLLFILAWLGADWASRFQFVVMALLIAALASFFVGGFAKWDSSLLSANWSSPENGPPFWLLFAIFFPAVTGFTQGVSMSGDLADPGRSIPLGTFLAVGLSIVVYLSVSILFAGTLPNSRLSTDYMAMKTVSAAGFFVDAGVVSATLSSAMASFMGAPRILQALSADRVFPFLNFFAKTDASTGNPRRGVMLAGTIALATIMLGQLNLIAGVVSMFFLISYGLLNFATYYEAGTHSPSFRPLFRWYHRSFSLMGFILCLGAMLAIDPKSGGAAIIFLAVIYGVTRRSDRPVRWVDSSRSHHMQKVRRHLIAAGKEPAHPRDWRPQLLVFSQNSDRRGPLLDFAAWIEGGSGFTEVVHIIEGEGAAVRKARDAAYQELSKAISGGNRPMFPMVVHTPDFSQAMGVLLQSSGIGPLQSNTVVVNWMGETAKAISGIGAYRYVKTLRLIFRQRKNLVLLHMDSESWDRLNHQPEEFRRIDVWWQKDATSRLMLLLAYLMTRENPWKKAEISVLTRSGATEPESERIQMEKNLEDMRIQATVRVVEDFEWTTIVEQSADASFVFLPMTIRENRILDPTGNSFDRSLPRLPVSAVVMAAEDIDLDAEPETGLPAQVARAADELEIAVKKAEAAKSKAKKKRSELESLTQELRSLEEKGVAGAVPLDLRKEMQEDLKDSATEAEKAHRRAIKADVKAEDAAQTLERLNAGSTDGTLPPKKG
jgi:amino acid transporter